MKKTLTTIIFTALTTSILCFSLASNLDKKDNCIKVMNAYQTGYKHAIEGKPDMIELLIEEAEYLEIRKEMFNNDGSMKVYETPAN